jgi:predicted LPLAT superfamily acyltransferase
MSNARTHWADLAERGAQWGPGTLAFVYRTVGRTACLAVMTPIILYFYITGGRQRRASLDYLARIRRSQGQVKAPGHRQALCHFFTFGATTLDRFAAWTGQVRCSEIDQVDAPAFVQARQDPRGALIISAHIGNPDVLRAVGTRERHRLINVIVHTHHAEHFNRVMKRFAPDSAIRLIEASDIGIAMAMRMSEAIERGEWVVIMGDRISVRHSERAVVADLLGAPVAVPEGPYLLAAALKCPVYFMFCPKVDGRYRVRFGLLADRVELPRVDRSGAIRQLVQSFLAPLEQTIREAPYQWFNFFDYWSPPARTPGRVTNFEANE